MRVIAALVCCFALSALAEAAEPRRLIVAKDGSGDYTTINDAMKAAKGATKEKPVDILIKPGTYEETITTLDWVNLIGEDREKCILTYHGGTENLVRKHTIWSTSNTTIRNLTIIGIQVKYCIHSDGGGPYVLKLEHCLLRRVYPEDVRRTYVAGFGIGLHARQHIVMRDCVIEAELPIYFHNWNDQSASCSMTIERCTLKGEKNAIGIYLLGSKQRDVFIIHDSILQSSGPAIKYVNMRKPDLKRPWMGNSEVELIGSGNTMSRVEGATMKDDSAKPLYGPDLEVERRIPFQAVNEDYGAAEGKTNTSGLWTAVKKGGKYHLQADLVEDALVFTCPSDDETAGRFGYAAGPSGSFVAPPLTLEIRMKLDLVKGGRAQLYYCCAPNAWLIEWQADKVLDGRNRTASLAVDTSEWQTYRVVAESAESVSLFVEGLRGDGLRLRPMKHGARYYQFRLFGPGSKTTIDWMKLRPEIAEE